MDLQKKMFGKCIKKSVFMLSRTELGAVVSYVGIVACFFWNACSVGASVFQNKPYNWLGLFLLAGFVISYLFFATDVVQMLIKKKRNHVETNRIPNRK